MAHFTAAHFFHNLISTLLVLPADYTLTDNILKFSGLLPTWGGKITNLWQDCCALDAYIAQLPYWDDWNGEWASSSVFPIYVNLLLVAVGLATAWNRSRFLGLAGFVR